MWPLPAEWGQFQTAAVKNCSCCICSFCEGCQQRKFSRESMFLTVFSANFTNSEHSD
jgi:hypothetical protein